MKLRWYIGLYVVGLALLLGIAGLESAPGYMDADYYYATGLRIATENDWLEPFLWNFLGEPDGLPQPAFTYWMPVGGIISALGMGLTGSTDFWSARIFFLLISACISPLAAYTAYSFTPQKWAAFLAGAFGIFSGYYLVYLPTTETFAIYMFLGGLVFIIIRRLQQDVLGLLNEGIGNKSENHRTMRLITSAGVYFAAGCIAGLMYMTRADGLVWLLMILVGISMQLRYFHSRRSNAAILLSPSGYWLPFLLCAVGFLLVSSPWLLRNWVTFGSIFAPGSGKALWLTRYDELFAFPANQLTFSRWLDQGVLSILQARSWALGLNAVSSLAVQGGIFLLPFSIAGMWAQRADWRVKLGAAGWIVVFLAMTVVFPFQGARGGFFHAGAGFQILAWALVPVGLAQFAEWGHRKRGWSPDSAVLKFGIGMVGLTVLVTGFLSWQRLSGAPGTVSAWGMKSDAYQLVERYLVDRDMNLEQVVMVNNPPGYYAATGRQAIVIPDGGLQAAKDAAEKFSARVIAIDENYPQGMEALYLEPGDFPGFPYLGSVSGIQIYRVDP